ncbi:43517_t:CDS:2 [Gigaspora margarita]|uniref:43517_t:CDS:1 n=1 Tax=Gigaspora margarita TaxID=4874 RepID=A0ABN7UT37_GIGMA|nr:43517_t:CDS:2 [Gigaspora margarita]
MLKHKEEIPQNVSAEVNKNNENISLQQMEQMNMDIQIQLAEASVVDNEDTKAQLGLKSLPDDCFLENIDDILRLPEQEIENRNPYSSGSTSTSGEVENACKPNLYSDHMHEDMQTEAAPHETQAESNESAINEENTHEEKVETPSVTSNRPDEGMEVEPADSLKDTKEEITHKEKVESPITASTSLDVEMVAESSDPLRDELTDLYGSAGNKENLPPKVVEANTNIEDMQASMLSQVKKHRTR